MWYGNVVINLMELIALLLILMKKQLNAYLKALNNLLKDKELLISNLLLVKEKLLDVNLSKPMEQANIVNDLCDQHIFNKEKKQMKYEAYIEEYVDLVKRLTKVQDKYNKLMAE